MPALPDGWSLVDSASYDTALAPAEEPKFAAWKQTYAPNDSGSDYDFRGAYKAGLTPSANGHWPDTYKKPNHPTFSDESIYASAAPEKAGHWEGEQFVPPAQVKQGQQPADAAPTLPAGWQLAEPPKSWLDRRKEATAQTLANERAAGKRVTDETLDLFKRAAKSGVDATGQVIKGAAHLQENLSNLADRLNPLIPAGSDLEARLNEANKQPKVVAAGEAVSRLADYYKPDKALDSSLASHLAEFAGSAAPVVASGPLALVNGAALVGQQAREASVKSGDSEEVANAKFILGTTVGAAAGAAPGSNLLKRLVPAEAVLNAPVRAAATEVAGHALAAGATGTGADATLQALTEGKVDWSRAAQTGALASVIGIVGGALKAAEANKLAATDREGLFLLARKLGFDGKSIEDLKQWHLEREAALDILKRGKQQNAKPTNEASAPATAEPPAALPEGWTVAGEPAKLGEAVPPAAEVAPTADALPAVREPAAAAVPAAPEGATVAKSEGETVVAPKPELEQAVSTLASKKQIKVQKEFLLDAVSKAAEAAKSSPQYVTDLKGLQKARNLSERNAQLQAFNAKHGDFITFHVPDDGTYRVYNNKEALTEFATKVWRKFGSDLSSPVPPRQAIPRLTPVQRAAHQVSAEPVTPPSKEMVVGDPMPASASEIAGRPSRAEIAKRLAQTSPEKLAELKQAIATPGIDFQYSIWDSAMLPPGEDRVAQVDIVPPPGGPPPGMRTIGGMGSTNRAVLAHLGVDLPPAPDWLPPGRYTAEEIKAAIRLGPPEEGSRATAAGDPVRIEAGMPPIPAGTPSARLNHKRMLVAMERIAPGVVDVPEVLHALRDVARAAGSTTDIREGRFNQKRARGIAKSWEEVIRLRELNNLPTAAHEIGHIVAKAVFGSMMSTPLMQASFPAAVNRELLDMGKALYGSSKPVAGYTSEGFAELVRTWLSTEDAPKKAPAATKWLEETLFPLQTAKSPHAELGAAMRKARDLFDIWRSQGAEARIGAQTKDEPGRLARFKEWSRKHLSARGVAEEFTPLEELAKAYSATTGNRLASGDNPYLIATAVRGTAGARLETWVEHGMTNIEGTVTGPSLKEAVAPIKPDNAQKFELYLTALQAIERLKQGKNPGIEPEDAVYVRAKYEKEHPEFVTAASNVADWWDGVLQYKRDAYPEVNGAIVDRVRAANPRYYGPLARVLDPDRVRAASAAATGGGLKKFKGSGLPIKKIILQSLKVAEGMIAGAHRDMVLRSVVNLSGAEGMGWVIEEVPRQRVVEQVNVEKLRAQLEEMGVDTTTLPEDTLLEYASHRDTPTGVDPIITVRENGAPRWYQVPAQVFEILQGVQEPSRLGLVFELLAGIPARAFKLGTTGVRASFSLVTNPVRDFPTFMLQSITGNPAERAASYLRSMFDVVRAGLGGNEAPAWQLAHQLGLQSSTFLGGDIAQARREANSLFHGRNYRRIMNPVETLREILSFTETVPRLAELEMLGRELGWKPGQPLTRDQAVAMMVAFKRVTTDFSAKGSQWRMFYRAVPFSNAGVQGVRSFGRAFKRDQGSKEKSYAAVRAILNGLALLTLPALYNWWRNKDEDWYRMLPWRERFLYLNVSQGRNVYQIPLPQEWGASFAVLPVALFESWHSRDAKPMSEAVKHIFSVLNPVDYPVLLKTAKEQWQNRIDFFDRPIVPRGEMDLLPGLQRSPYSSELAKELGDIFPGQVSPRRFDAAVRQVFGGVGSDVMDTPGALMRALGLKVRDKARESEASDVPVFGRLARRGGAFTANSQPLVEFWDDYNRYGALKASNQRAIRDRTPQLAPMNFRQQAYASRLEALEPWIKLRLELAERTPELDKRQAIYRAASERAARLLAQRPPAILTAKSQ